MNTKIQKMKIIEQAQITGFQTIMIEKTWK